VRTIALISQKGGAGKTTLAVALAVAAQQAGCPAVVVDLDPQASAAGWGDLREADEPIVTYAPALRLGAVLEAARAAGAGIAILDTAPHAAGDALAAARAADFVLIPCRPATADLRSIGASVDLLRIAGKPGAVVVNAAPIANPLTTQAIEAIAGYSVPACPVVVHQRIAHVHAFTTGRAAAETEQNGKAAAEISALYAWLQRNGNGE